MKCPFCGFSKVIVYECKSDPKEANINFCGNCRKYFVNKPVENKVSGKVSGEDLVGMGGYVDDDGDIAP